jgi:PST family polysaccharide transporter
VAIALAIAGLGAASIVIGYLAGTVALSATLWAVVPWRPRVCVAGDRTSPCSSASAPPTAAWTCSPPVSANVDYLFVGRVLGPAALGLYSIAFRLPDLLVMNLSLVAGRVLFPAFAAVAREALTGAYLVPSATRCSSPSRWPPGWPRWPSR